MAKENICLYIHNGILFDYYKEWDPVIYNNADENKEHMLRGTNKAQKDMYSMISFVC